MTTQVFTNSVTLTAASWFNDVDDATYSGLTSPAGTNTITATGPANFAYTSLKIVRWIPAGTNTGATTINITPLGGSALGEKNVFCNGVACVGREIVNSVPAQAMYDGTQFQLMGPRSVRWTTPTFAAGDYTGNGSMTWTVASGDVTTYAYTIIDKMMTVAFLISTTTVGGTPSTNLQIAIPASKTATKTMVCGAATILDNNVRTTGAVQVTAAETLILINRTDNAAWTASTNQTEVGGIITFEIN